MTTRNLRIAAGAATMALACAFPALASPASKPVADHLVLAQADTDKAMPRKTDGAMKSNTVGKTAVQSGMIDVTRVASGLRADKVIGAEVYNNANDSIGTIDDLIIEPNDRVVYAIVSVGGFLGIGDRLVAVPFDRITYRRDGDDVQMVLPESTKANLESMPEFRYTR